MLLLLIASVTGVWLVFSQEIDRALNAKLRVVEPRATRLSEDEIVRLVERRFPGQLHASSSKWPVAAARPATTRGGRRHLQPGSSSRRNE